MKNLTRPLVLAFALTAAAAATGCAGLSTDKLAAGMQNRVTTTLDCKRGFLASLYGPFGLTSEIDAADVPYLPCGANRPAPAK